MNMLAAIEMNFGERAAYAGRMLLIGMATVFAVLTVLWVSLTIFRLFVSRKKKAAPTAPIPAPEPAVPVATAADPGELIAVITAAVAAARAAGGEAPAFRVVSFRKINTLQK